MLYTIAAAALILGQGFPVFSLNSPAAGHPAPFRFAIMGCAHFGVCESKDYENAVEKIREQRPDFVIFLGGMVDMPRSGDLESSKRKFDSITAGLGVPVYDVPGYCRFNPLYARSGDRDKIEKMYLDRYKKRFYSFVHKNNLFICLDSDEISSSYRDGSGFADTEQQLFLKKTLADTSRYDNVFLSQSLSPWSKSDAPEGFKAFHGIIKGRVKYVFGASEHFFDLKKIDDVTYITSGSPPCFTQHFSSPIFYHFLMVQVDGGKASVSVVPLKSIPIENMGILKDEGTSFNIVKQKEIKSDSLDSPDRKAILPVEKIVEALAIRPGMSILDVGAGRGLFTFPFAKATGASGRVYATDVDPGMTEYLAGRIREKGCENIIPVRVRADVLDSFYGKHSFDVIFLSEVYQYLWRPVEYFRGLKPALAGGDGRLYIIHFKNYPDFSEFEFDDFGRVLKILKSFGERSVIFSKIGGGAQDFIKNWQGGAVPDDVREKIVRNFNALLADRELLGDLAGSDLLKAELEKHVWGQPLMKSLYARDVPLAGWMITRLDEKGVFDDGGRALDGEEEKSLRVLNRILLSGVFKLDKLSFLKGRHTLYAEKDSVIATLKAAGFRFVREHDFLTYFHFLEFQ